MLIFMKSIPGYARYLISDTGEVVKDNGLRLKPHESAGYRVVKLTSDAGKRTSFGVHRLVVLAHVGPIPDGMWINHKNGIKHDNRVENLEIVTPSENLMHAYQTLRCNRARGERVHTAKLTPEAVEEIRNSPLSQRRLAAKFGVSQVAVHNVRSGRSWK